MRLRHLPLMLCLLLPATAHASETPAEHAANVYAAQELAAAPPHGNLPDYSLSPVKLATAQRLASIRVTLHFAAVLWSIAALVLLFVTGLVTRMRNTAVRAGDTLRAKGSPVRAKWREGLVFAFLFTAASTLLELPLSIYGHHLSLAYGFSVQGWGSWFADVLKTFALTFATTVFIFMLVFRMMLSFPRRWWLGVWAVMAPVTYLVIYITPILIDPLYNKFEPLAQTNPALVTRLQQVAARGGIDIPPERMFLMRASAKVTTINAYVTGFGGSKRLVFWDTAVAKMQPDQLLFVFGHESGHYMLHHIVKGTLASFAGMLVLAWLSYFLVNAFRRRFSARLGITEMHDWTVMAFLALVVVTANVIAEPIYQGATRVIEHDADVFGAESVHGIVAEPQEAGRGAFAALGENTFDDPNPNPLIEFWTYSHPAIGRRAAFAKAYNPWAPGMQPKYFPAK